MKDDAGNMAINRAGCLQLATEAYDRGLGYLRQARIARRRKSKQGEANGYLAVALNHRLYARQWRRQARGA